MTAYSRRFAPLVVVPALARILACAPEGGVAPSTAPTVADSSAPSADSGDARAEGGAPVQVTCTDPATLTEFPQDVLDARFRALSPAKYQWGRCELVALIVDAASAIHAEMPDVSPIGVADLSQEDGEIPGTDVGVPRHPAPSHTKGFSADITYFRRNGKTLEDSPACVTKNGDFCDGSHDVDVVPTARLFAYLARSKRLAQIIVDPMMMDDLGAALDALAQDGVDGATTARGLLTTNVPLHTDHFHFSVSRACYDGKDNDGDGKTDLDDPNCADAIDDDEGS